MKRIVLIAAALAASGGGLSAGEARDARQAARVEAMFDRLDAIRDGAIDRAEAEAARAMRFAAADTDRDGALTAREIVDAAVARARLRAERRATRMLARLDKNADGALSQAEFEGARRRSGGGMMARLDTDGDGAVTRAEALAASRQAGLK